MSAIDMSRVRVLAEGASGAGPVVYAMARDQRAEDNWALLHAQQLAKEMERPLVVACPLAADYPSASRRQIDFMLAGLAEVARRLAEMRIPFVVASGGAAERMGKLIHAVDAAALVCDFSPLRESQVWKTALTDRVKIPVFEVDAHNVVPCWEAAGKQEYAAYTIRPKINRLLGRYLDDFPALQTQGEWPTVRKWPEGWTALDVVRRGDAHECCGLVPGAEAAWRTLQEFLDERLQAYDST